jgi:hypothetical protein
MARRIAELTARRCGSFDGCFLDVKGSRSLQALAMIIQSAVIGRPERS